MSASLGCNKSTETNSNKCYVPENEDTDKDVFSTEVATRRRESAVSSESSLRLGGSVNTDDDSHETNTTHNQRSKHNPERKHTFLIRDKKAKEMAKLLAERTSEAIRGIQSNDGDCFYAVVAALHTNRSSCDRHIFRSLIAALGNLNQFEDTFVAWFQENPLAFISDSQRSLLDRQVALPLVYKLASTKSNFASKFSSTISQWGSRSKGTPYFLKDTITCLRLLVEDNHVKVEDYLHTLSNVLASINGFSEDKKAKYKPVFKAIASSLNTLLLTEEEHEEQRKSLLDKLPEEYLRFKYKKITWSEKCRIRLIPGLPKACE